MSDQKIAFIVLDNSNILHVDLSKVKFIATNSTGGMGCPGVLLIFAEGSSTQVFAGTDFKELTLLHNTKTHFTLLDSPDECDIGTSELCKFLSSHVYARQDPMNTIGVK